MILFARPSYIVYRGYSNCGRGPNHFTTSWKVSTDMVFTIAKLNRISKEQRDCLFLQLIPESLFSKLSIDPVTLTNRYGECVVQGFFPYDENFACIEVKSRLKDNDLTFYCQISLDTFMNSVYLDFVGIIDPLSDRFNVDIDECGKDTLFGSQSRNIKEEIKAMEAGLAPGMVRRGMRLLGEFMKSLERFTLSLGLNTISLGALYYHNAIQWERYGFNYFKGGKLMKRINEEFQPKGLLYQKLDDSSPFRRRGMDRTVRGRSWAIYDGILAEAFGEDWEAPKMYKMVGKDYNVNTFPDHIY